VVEAAREVLVIGAAESSAIPTVAHGVEGGRSPVALTTGRTSTTTVTNQLKRT